MKKINLTVDVNAYKEIYMIVDLDDVVKTLTNKQVEYILKELSERVEDRNDISALSKYINISGDITEDEIDVKIDIDDFLSECSKEEIKYITKKLKENYYNFDHISHEHGDFLENTLIKLSQNYHCLSKEDIDKIKEISDKL